MRTVLVYDSPAASLARSQQQPAASCPVPRLQRQPCSMDKQAAETRTALVHDSPAASPARVQQHLTAPSPAATAHLHAVHAPAETGPPQQMPSAPATSHLLQASAQPAHAARRPAPAGCQQSGAEQAELQTCWSISSDSATPARQQESPAPEQACPAHRQPRAGPSQQQSHCASEARAGQREQHSRQHSAGTAVAPQQAAALPAAEQAQGATRSLQQAGSRSVHRQAGLSGPCLSRQASAAEPSQQQPNPMAPEPQVAGNDSMPDPSAASTPAFAPPAKQPLKQHSAGGPSPRQQQPLHPPLPPPLRLATGSSLLVGGSPKASSQPHTPSLRPAQRTGQAATAARPAQEQLRSTFPEASGNRPASRQHLAVSNTAAALALCSCMQYTLTVRAAGLHDYTDRAGRAGCASC